MCLTPFKYSAEPACPPVHVESDVELQNMTEGLVRHTPGNSLQATTAARQQKH